MKDVDRALSSTQAAEYIGLKPGTLAHMRVRSEGPKYAKIGNKVFYRLKDVIRWLEAHTIDTEREKR